MTPQIIGTKKSKSFRACVRYCKERGIEFQERDPIEKPLSEGELAAITAAVPAEEIVDTESKTYKTRGLAWMEYDPVEEVAEDASLLRQPIVRTDAGVVIQPDVADLDAVFGR